MASFSVLLCLRKEAQGHAAPLTQVLRRLGECFVGSFYSGISPSFMGKLLPRP